MNLLQDVAHRRSGSAQRMPRPPLADRVRQLRAIANLSRAELAERTGVSVSLLGFIETGFRTKFEMATLTALADALKAELVVDLVPRAESDAHERLAAAVAGAGLTSDDLERLLRIIPALHSAPAAVKDGFVLALEGFATTAATTPRA